MISPCIGGGKHTDTANESVYLLILHLPVNAQAIVALPSLLSTTPEYKQKIRAEEGRGFYKDSAPRLLIPATLY
eukprot:507426-Amorphochlora_amoeboformis.AAC.1